MTYKSTRNLFIAVPTYDGFVRSEAFEGLRRPSDTCDKLTVQRQPGSLLAYIFNQLWHACYNSYSEFGWTHFGMHHADVEAPPLWADVLMDEMERTGADLMSVVVPIKDLRGLSSTGMALPKNGTIRRLTMREVYKLPETFAAEDVSRVLPETFPPGSVLAANTGLWVCNFEKFRPFMRPQAMGKDDPGLFFSILDAVREEKNGNLTACVLSEDWHFSRACHARGLTVACTRKVRVNHYGEAHYPNSDGWGNWETDRGDTPPPDSVPEDKEPLAPAVPVSTSAPTLAPTLAPAPRVVADEVSKPRKPSEWLDQHGSDKNSFNGYGPTYDELFAGKEQQVQDVLEIGVLGGASLKAWRDVFSNARIVGLDVRPPLDCGERIQTYTCNASDPQALQTCLGQCLFDVIIDDGSHLLSDQTQSLAYLWPRVKPGGVYVVEDVQSSGDLTALRNAFQHFKFAGTARVADLCQQVGHLGATMLIFQKPGEQAPAPVNHQVRGWLTADEGQTLMRLARDKEVLELGSFEGCSTICLAHTARRVHSVDWHRGDSWTQNELKEAGEPRYTLPAFAANLATLQVADKVTVQVGRFEDVLPTLPAQSYDIVFVDGAKDYDGALSELRHACRLVRRGGAIAVYGTHEKKVALAASTAGLGKPLATCGKLSIYEAPAVWLAA